MGYLHEGELESDEADEHEDEQDAAGELEVALGLVVAERGHAGEERLALLAALGQHQQQRAAQRQVAEEELHVPQDVVGNRLQQHDAEQQAARHRHLHRRIKPLR